MASNATQPALPPPTSALPQLPMSKLRIPSTTAPTTAPTTATPSKLGLRTPSKIIKPPTLSTSHSTSSPDIPTLRSTSNASNTGQGGDPLADKEVRRSVSIANFPQPPKVRRTGIESKYSTASSSPSRGNETGEARRGSFGVKKLKTRASADMLSRTYSTASTPSLLNGSGEGKAVSSEQGIRASNDIMSPRSPPHSRSSSAQESYSTSATTFEDIEEKRGRDEVHIEERGKRRESERTEKEGKGNVLVSVRVRPDAGGDKTSGKDWLVDSRQSLVAYRGREGGDYYYGMPKICPRNPSGSQILIANNTSLQTTSSRHMIKITKFTMLVRNGLCVVLWRVTTGQFLPTA